MTVPSCLWDVSTNLLRNLITQSVQVPSSLILLRNTNCRNRPRVTLEKNAEKRGKKPRLMMTMMLRGSRYSFSLLFTTDVRYKQFRLSQYALVVFCSLAEDACSIQVQHDVLFTELLPVCLLTAWYQQNLNFHPHNTNFEVTTPVCV